MWLFFSGFDIGNHFCEFMFDYKRATEWPFYLADFTFYPDENQQVRIDLVHFSDRHLSCLDEFSSILCRSIDEHG